MEDWRLRTEDGGSKMEDRRLRIPKLYEQPAGPAIPQSSDFILSPQSSVLSPSSQSSVLSPQSSVLNLSPQSFIPVLSPSSQSSSPIRIPQSPIRNSFDTASLLSYIPRSP